jgi:hypothetical protein
MAILPVVISSGSAAITSHLQSNMDAIEAFLTGGVLEADLETLQQYQVPLGELSAATTGSLAGANSLPNVELATPIGKLHQLDSDSVIDFMAHTIIDVEVDSVLATAITETVFAERFLFERMGHVPVPVGHSYQLDRSPMSWNDWRWAFDEPTSHATMRVSDRNGNYTRTYQYAPDGEYYTTWKTVPGAADLIYVPAGGMIRINAMARGTFNAVARSEYAYSGTAFDTSNDPQFLIPPIEFRLFVERVSDGGAKDSVFSWEANAREFSADWTPVTDGEDVAVEDFVDVNDLAIPVTYKRAAGWHADVQSFPRADVVLKGWVVVPTAGWYRIAAKVNSRYWYGYDDYESHTDFVFGFHYGTTILDGTSAGREIGPMTLARWEYANIQAAWQALRTEATDDPDHADFAAS